MLSCSDASIISELQVVGGNGLGVVVRVWGQLSFSLSLSLHNFSLYDVCMFVFVFMCVCVCVFMYVCMSDACVH